MTSRSIVNRSRTPRRARQWALTATNGSLVAATSAGKLIVDLGQGLEDELASNLHNITASALRYNISYRQTTSQAGDDDTVAMGVAWVSTNALTAGPASVPNPGSDNWDWMFHDIRTITNHGGADSDFSFQNAQWSISNNSMRKQRENNSALVMVFQAILLQSVSVQVFVGGRVLLLLP